MYIFFKPLSVWNPPDTVPSKFAVKKTFAWRCQWNLTSYSIFTFIFQYLIKAYKWHCNLFTVIFNKLVRLIERLGNLCLFSMCSDHPICVVTSLWMVLPFLGWEVLYINQTQRTVKSGYHYQGITLYFLVINIS